jgi:hypothetical protein
MKSRNIKDNIAASSISNPFRSEAIMPKISTPMVA